MRKLNKAMSIIQMLGKILLKMKRTFYFKIFLLVMTVYLNFDIIHAQSIPPIEKLNTISGKWLKNVYYSQNNYLIFLYCDSIKVIDCNKNRNYSFAIPEDSGVDSYPILEYKSNYLLLKNKKRFIELDLIHLKVNINGELLDKINSLAPDIIKMFDGGQLWLICKQFTSLVNISTNKEISLLGKIDKIEDNCGIFDFIQDENKNFWILTSFGIYKVSTTEMPLISCKYLTENILNGKLFIIHDKLYFMDNYKGLIVFDIVTDKYSTFKYDNLHDEIYGKDLIKTKHFLYAFVTDQLTKSITLFKIDSKNETKFVIKIDPFDDIYHYNEDKFIVKRYNNESDDYDLNIILL